MKDDDKVRLRPVEERDLDALGLIDTDPSVSEPFEWRGFSRSAGSPAPLGGGQLPRQR
jgi:hypothetical protein